jgi:hypothetical protein
MTALAPDRDQIEIFVEAIFRSAKHAGFVSLRSFFDTKDGVFQIVPISMVGGLPFLIDEAVRYAATAAESEDPIVFCPPLAVFANRKQARETDVAEALALSIECDRHPQQARQTLEALLGPATVVVQSGGTWANGGTAPEPKLHLHWRLARPARGPQALKKLKQARTLATRLVGGDASNVPPCHPIRWPGSWHRKKEPRLCSIETALPDIEIDLDAALAALTAAAPPEPARPATGEPAGDWDTLVADVISGASYHAPLTAFAARCIGGGMKDGQTVNLLRSIMNAVIAPHDERWQARFDEIARIVRSAKEKFEKPASPPPAPLIKTLPQFLAGFVPPDYLIEGILQRHYFYSLTGMTGAGKTAVALLMAVLTANPEGGQKLGPYEIVHGRVLYVACENSTDVRMRLIGMAQRMELDPDKLDLLVIEQFADTLEKELSRIAVEVEAFGPIVLVVVDTSAAIFPGDDENNNPQMMAHAKVQRRLCDLPGRPCVVALCHPPKNVSSPEQLLPRGGGGYLNETDGNLILFAHDDRLSDLHWTGKFRGPDFDKITFRMETVTTAALTDSKGRLLPTVMAKVVSEGEALENEEKAILRENRLIAAIVAVPDGSVADWARHCGWMLRASPGEAPQPNKSLTHRVLKRLVENKLVQKKGRLYVPTKAGIDAAPKAAAARAGKERPKPVVIGPAEPGTHCEYCHDVQGDVLRIRDGNVIGSKAYALHQVCAEKWFGNT